MTTISPHNNIQLSLLERLPPELLTKTLGFVEFTSQWRLASCNKRLMKSITQDCAELWTHIRFASNTTGRELSSLTDTILDTILERVNAKDRTISLDLTGCKNIAGMGLVSLRRSRVFERVKLDSPWEELNMKAVTWVLETMILHKLFEVHLPMIPRRFVFGTTANDIDRMDQASIDTRASFFAKLRLGKVQQARDERVSCSSCDRPVCEESRQVVPDSAGFPLYCSACTNRFCRTGSCPVDMKECSWCLETSCGDCNNVHQCRTCGTCFCRECDPMPHCDYCEDYYCDTCTADSPVAKCDICERRICGDCRGQRAISVSYCMTCTKRFCSECSEGRHCETCLIPSCDDCAKICQRCNGCWCERHSTVQNLDCDCCTGQDVCVACTDMKICCECSRVFCGNSDELQVCENPACRDHVCRNCCAEWDFVSCENCGISYCNGCTALVRCCPQCGNECCRKCRTDSGGLCNDCAERPSKKARTE